MTSPLLVLLYVVLYPVSLLPLSVLYIKSSVLAFLLENVFHYRKKVVMQNLQKSFPDKNPQELNHIAHLFYRNLSDIIVENIKLISMSGEELKKRCTFENPEVVHSYYDKNKSLIAAVAHYNNWELAGLSLALNFKYRIMAVYKPVSNSAFNEFMKRIRGRFGTVLIPMKETGKEMIRRRHQKTLTVFITDQTPSNTQTAHWIDFLNRDTPVFTGLERIAAKLDTPVIFCKLSRLKRGQYSVRFVPVSDASSDAGKYEITGNHTRILEDIIKEEPANWLWSHKRWKHRRPSPEPYLEAANNFKKPL